MVWCCIASLAVGIIYFHSLPYLLSFCLSSAHLNSFASYNRPYALKIKYRVTKACQFLLNVVFCMLLYVRLRTFCMLTESLLYKHSLDQFAGLFFSL